jgi:serine protease Do
MRMVFGVIERLRRMRLVAIALSLILTACSTHSPSHKKQLVLMHSIAATAQVFTVREGGTRRAGSAIVLSQDASQSTTFILTAAHLLEPPVEQSIYILDPATQNRVPADLIAIDSDADLALLAAPIAAGEPVRLALGGGLADEVLVVAFPWGRARTVVNGAVSQVAAEESTGQVPLWGDVKLIDASVSYGMSGGGIFDKQSGRLLGIVRGYRTAHLALTSEAAPLKLPIAGETTVISTHDILCFLDAKGLGGMANAVLSGEIPTERCRDAT